MKNKILDKKLVIDKEKCIHCGLCEKTCWNGALKLDKDGCPQMCITELKNEWNMCWECQRCLAVCPQGALSICGKKPEDVLSRELIPSSQQMDALITNRRSCRSFKQENVDRSLIDHILHVCGNSPTGSCNQLVEFTVIDDVDVMREFTETFHEEMFTAAEKGILPGRFDKDDIALFKKLYDGGESFLFRGAPHALFAHAPIGKGEWIYDTMIALTYAELLMTANDLGVIFVSTPAAALDICPKSKAFLNIPDNHYISIPMGFGKPEYEFCRGVQRSDALKIHYID